MGTWQVAGRHQKFSDNFTPGKNESRFEKLYPLRFAARVVGIQPGSKRATFLANQHQAAGILDCCRNFTPVADYPGICQQTGGFYFAVGSDPVNVKPVVGAVEVVFLVEDGLW